MSSKKYIFGGITFEIESPVPISDARNCADFLTDDPTVPDYRICVMPAETDSPEKQKTERTGNTIYRYVFEKNITNLSAAHLLSSSDAAYLFPAHDAFILHASYIIHDGRAILFTAPSGTGKSTQAAFWQEQRGAEIINGDRVLITRRNGQFLANGIYASGTSGISRNVTSPIGAVVLLEQGKENRKNDIPARLLFLRILCECSYNINDAEQYEKITELVSDMINTVPALCYQCRNNPDAVEALERILWNKK